MNRRTVLLISGAVIGVGLILVLGAFVMTGFQPQKLSTAEAVSETHEIEEPFTGLDIRTFSSDVRFAIADDGKTRVESTHDAQVRESTGVTDGILNVWQESTGSGVHFGIYYTVDDHITVYLPQSEYETLFVETTSGDINVSAPFAFERIKIDTGSGEVKCFAQCRENLSIETTSGDIDAGSVTAHDVNLTSTSGEVELEDLIATGTLTVRTTSGDIEFDRCDAGTIDIDTTSGEVEGTLRSGKTFDISTMSGEVEVPANTPGAGLCRIGTTSGDVKLRVAG